MAQADSLTDDARFTRYLKTGTQGNFYLPGKNKTFRYTDNVLVSLISQGKGESAVEELVCVSKDKSFVKREPLLFMLAVAVNTENQTVKHAAYSKVSEVCVDTRDFFTFLKHNKNYGQFRKGWGRAQRKAVNVWYNSKDAYHLAELVTRYKCFSSWAHRDVFRMAHITPSNEAIALVVRYVVEGLVKVKDGQENASNEIKRILSYLEAVQIAKHSEDSTTVAGLIEKHDLRIEHLPTQRLSSKDVWVSLLENMSLADVLHHLPALASRCFLTIATKGGSTDDSCKLIQSKVLEKVKDVDAIEKERIGPITIYNAIKKYSRAFTDRSELKGEHREAGGKRKDNPPSDINKTEQPSKKKKKKKKGGVKENEKETDSASVTTKSETDVSASNPELFESLYAAFKVAVEKNVPTTNKRFLIAVKAAMSAIGQAIRGCPVLTSLEVMALMAAIIHKKESHRELGFFTASFNTIKYPAEMQDLIQEIGGHAAPVPHLKCDPAAPIMWALEKKKPYDVFLVISDGLEIKGEVSPAAKLKEYREKMNLPDTKMILCGLHSPKMDFAEDAGMLDIGGFDDTVPEVINMFIQGEI